MLQAYLPLLAQLSCSGALWARMDPHNTPDLPKVAWGRFMAGSVQCLLCEGSRCQACQRPQTPAAAAAT